MHAGSLAAAVAVAVNDENDARWDEAEGKPQAHPEALRRTEVYDDEIVVTAVPRVAFDDAPLVAASTLAPDHLTCTVTSADNPARSVSPFGTSTSVIFTGTRCTTFTKLPDALSGGRSAKRAPVAGEISSTRP